MCKFPPHAFIQPYRVQAEDLDFLGHVNNKVYLHWMEQVAWQHSLAVGIDHALQKRLNRIMAVYEHHMHYLGGCYLDDELLIVTWLGEQIGCCKRERFYQILRARDKKLLFKARSVYVCIELDSHRPRPIPQEFTQPYLDKV
ncbi:acyl-CoA thioesterase [Thiomicrorhabdus heinhorstiae]|uniref:Acyl-CoA thioesterase n=1 Tax=Thiomicrorhabdus heinhorstiae TaxID=2748010 RepID=A0ABS0BZ29_9GAMM|nr:thioesterase family protein [Thiomicrorhabdus heinhorstiae]MBF6057332.1 acyl-CoA thioesterase [Thiomicrorhabdus heinhorstiae]